MPTPQRSAVYSNGAMTATGADLNATVMRNSATAPIAPVATIQLMCSGRISFQPFNASAVLTSVMISIDQKMTLMLESVFVSTLMTTALTAYETADANAASAPIVARPDADGLSITSTPQSPMMIASQRCHPTRSRRIGTDNAVTISGAE